MRRGVTLVELIMSAGLVFILLAVAFWGLDPVGRGRKARDEQRIADLDTLRTALDQSLEDEETELARTFGVPSSTVGIDVSTDPSGGGWIAMEFSDRFSELPKDPLNGKTFEDVLGSSVLGEYQFISDGKFYVIRTHLEYLNHRTLYSQDGSDNSWYEVGSAPGMSTYFGL